MSPDIPDMLQQLADELPSDGASRRALVGLIEARQQLPEMPAPVYRPRIASAALGSLFILAAPWMFWIQLPRSGVGLAAVAPVLWVWCGATLVLDAVRHAAHYRRVARWVDRFNAAVREWNRTVARPPESP